MMTKAKPFGCQTKLHVCFNWTIPYPTVLDIEKLNKNRGVWCELDFEMVRPYGIVHTIETRSKISVVRHKCQTEPEK